MNDIPTSPMDADRPKNLGGSWGHHVGNKKVKILEKTDEIRFQPIKEARTGYFIEYYPPVSGERFANLYLVFLEKPEPKAVCEAMEHEFLHWVNRYPLPIMASSFDEAGDLYYLEKEKGCNHLIGYVAGDGSIKKHWQLIKDEELPEKALDTDYLMVLFQDIPFSSQSEKKMEWEKRVRKIQAGWYLVFVWAVAVPAIIALLGYANPFVSWLALGYAWINAYIKGMKLAGKWPKTQREIDEERERAEMEHHHYHCKENPEGFLRLKVENFERWEREKIKAEFTELSGKGDK
jgi:hypothetical protein